MPGDIKVDGIREIVEALRAMPERLDKDMRKEFRGIAKAVETTARGRAQGARPARTTPPSKGSYSWKQLVNSIKAGAESDSPIVQYGSPAVPGWAGWEFGSDRLPQFPPRRAGKGGGRFFFPAVRATTDDVFKAAEEVVERYAREAGLT